ncbi:DNA-binding response regulator [uncultured Psychroserpens sp.]|uniref:LytR/AlgR family response regulator transcription factor n=1 Tax=uncultured Psychroserpens sp. TaxID=255436 RepID=UPI00261C2FDB|nr:DNA-binding response regulator [uncultured Psychroserpens sp.]
MEKIKVLALEDNKRDIALLEDALSDKHFEIVAIDSELDDAIQHYQTLEFDVVIIDIFISNQPLGIKFAEIINTSNIKKPFIFLTSSIDKNVFNTAKTLDPNNYLIKPFNRSELLFAIELSLESFLHTEGAFANKQPVFYNKAFFIRDGKSLVKVGIDEIKYITIEGSYSNMVTEKGDFIIQSSLNQMMNGLPTDTFIKSHRNYIVNIEKIDKIYTNDNLIILTTGENILLSRRNRDNLFNKYKVLK